MLYTIIIPIYNEERILDLLISKLYEYHIKGHQITIINDGSTDNSNHILKNHSFINLIISPDNYGKGHAIRMGLIDTKYDKIIIYDGDLELSIKDISKLMVLSKQKNIKNAMGVRSKNIYPLESVNHWGNFMFTIFFNFLYMTSHKDILCCAKSFYKKDIPYKKLKSNKFDIDIELASIITKNNRGRQVPQILIDYNRRSIEQGKKLRTSDGWSILKSLIKNRFN